MAARFPQGEIPRGLSGGIYRPNHSADGAGWAVGAFANAAARFGQQVQERVDVADAERGLDEAARDAGAGSLQLRGGLRPGDRAYDRAAREYLSAERRAAASEALTKAELDNADSPSAYTAAVEAARAGFQATGDGALDLDLAEFFTLQSAAGLARVSRAQRERQTDIARGAFRTSLTVEQDALDRTAAGAGFDETGGQLVGSALQRFVEQIGRYGPREGFAIGDIEFAEDPERLEALDADTIAQLFLQAQAQARTTWVINAQRALPNAAAKAAFAEDVGARWRAGDPMLAGIDGPGIEALARALDGEVTGAANSERAMQTAAEQRTNQLLDVLRYGGDVDPEELRAAAEASGDPGKMQEVEYRLLVGFEVAGAGGRSFDGDYSVAPGFAAAANFVIDQIEGGDVLVADDNGRGASRFGITAHANPDLDIRNLTRDAAVGRYRRYWDAVNGDVLPPELALVAFDAAVNHGEGKARAMLAESGGDVGRFLALREAEYRRLAAADPARYGDDLNGWMNRLGKVRGAAARIAAMAGSVDGFASDPLKYAMGGASRPALADVTVLPIDALGTPEFAAALRARQATGRALAERYQVPARIVMDGEAQALRQRLAADPAAAVALAGAAVEALGGEGARALMREIGRENAGAEIHIADLAAMGNANFARTATEGLVARAGGARLPPYRDGEVAIAQLGREWAGAIGNQAGVLHAAMETAELARLADITRGVERPADYYLQAALGSARVNGVTYGGVVELNGQVTLLPEWLARDDARDAVQAWMEHLAESDTARPVYSNGEPMPAREAARSQLILLANGRYGLVRRATGAVIRRADGGPLELDLDTRQARDVARRARIDVRPGY